MNIIEHLQSVIKTANEWTPGCNRWDVFENMPREPQHLRWCFNATKLLALAQESGDAAKIEKERNNLLGAIESWTEAGQPTEVAAEPVAEVAVEPQMSLAARCVLGVATGALIGTAIKHGGAKHVLRSATSAIVFGAVRGAMR